MQPKRIHPLINEANEQLRKGTISRRDFLRFSTLLGMSLATANVMAACGPAEEATVVAPAATEAMKATEVPAATEVMSGIVRGGTLTAATRVERVDHPARFSLVSQAGPWRHVFDYLTYTNPQGITEPYMLESWEASDDLLTWTLKLKKGIKFSNGKEFTADDVLFNFSQWLSLDIGSSLLGAMSYMDPNGQEKVDDYTVVCNLVNPTIFLPEHLFHYGACVLPAEFGGDISLEPIGTGAFTMEEYVPGERCRLKARPDYWRMGADSKPLPYLDEIIMVQLGEDRAADLAALQTGQVDTIIEPPVSVWEAVKDDDKFTVVGTPTSATRTLRMRVDQEPWDKNEVRQAFKHCHNREKILALALLNQGVIGNDSHVSPAHPEFVDIPPYPFDTAKSLELLAAAGYADAATNPVKVELTVASDWPESMAYAQALKEDALAGGFDITLNPMPASQYWEGWTEWNLGITWWSHRPLAPMVLALAYIRDSEGNPIPWNESHWLDDEFEALLKESEATLDLAARKELVGKMEVIQKERGSICTPFFMNVWKIYAKNVHDVDTSPEEFAIFHATWKEAEG
jgi:peptide/nickel transport system substrate-binding protein